MNTLSTVISLIIFSPIIVVSAITPTLERTNR